MLIIFRSYIVWRNPEREKNDYAHYFNAENLSLTFPIHVNTTWAQSIAYQYCNPPFSTTTSRIYEAKNLEANTIIIVVIRLWEQDSNKITSRRLLRALFKQTTKLEKRECFFLKFSLKSSEMSPFSKIVTKIFRNLC